MSQDQAVGVALDHLFSGACRTGAKGATVTSCTSDWRRVQPGDAFVAVADVSMHQFVVSINDQVVQTMPASLGKPGYETPIGTFPVIEKFREMVMDSSTLGVPIDSPEGYRLDVEYAVRITWGGVFVHAAPWSVGQQGRANVSHGCINLSTQNAKWFYDNAKKGDPVIVRW